MRRVAAKYLTMVAMIGGMAATASVTNCGGSSGNRPTTGAGGSGGTGTGGSTGTGGTGTGGSGTTADGGGGTNGTLNCSAALSPTTGNVTDFSDWSPTAGKWGDPAGLFGAKFSYAGTGSSITRAEVEAPDGGAATARDFHVVASLVPPEVGGTYAGAGLSFNSCTNVSAYTGLQFKVSGTLGGCQMEVQLQTFSQKPKTDNPAGGCDSACFAFPKKAMLVPSDTTPITVMFADLMPWAGATDAAQIVGIQWQFTVPSGADGGVQASCDVDVHIDDVKFIQ